MLESFERGHSGDWVPIEALFEEVNEELVWAAAQHLLQSLGGGTALAASRVGDQNRGVVLWIEK